MTGLPSTEALLTSGGDTRILCGPDGRNKYGCRATPDTRLLAYGSCTASTISPESFAAAEATRQRLITSENSAETYASELALLRHELTDICGLSNLTGLDIIFAASGTDLHLFVPQLISTDKPVLVAMIEGSETGSGVPAALSGRHFSQQAPFARHITPNTRIPDTRAIDLAIIPSRTDDGRPRPSQQIDADMQSCIEEAVNGGKRVLLIITDVTKTGLIAPSPALALAMQKRFPANIDILVDACQFRLSKSTLRTYLEHDFLVAITGSKFIGGPAFCGALLVPAQAATRLQANPLPLAMADYSAKSDWPAGWEATATLPDATNYGLLLRWQAALSELRRFHALPETAISRCVSEFVTAIHQRLVDDPAFEIAPVPALNRAPLSPSDQWDALPTIIPFLVRYPDGRHASQEETANLYAKLQQTGCQPGQPVACGYRDNIPVSALRLCLSTRLIVDGVSGRGNAAVIADAMMVLDKIASLITQGNI